ncbi:hypothetical protein KCU66_g3, partial [Aureobasidium melanogenum]
LKCDWVFDVFFMIREVGFLRFAICANLRVERFLNGLQNVDVCNNCAGLGCRFDHDFHLLLVGVGKVIVIRLDIEVDEFGVVRVISTNFDVPIKLHNPTAISKRTVHIYSVLKLLLLMWEDRWVLTGVW